MLMSKVLDYIFFQEIDHMHQFISTVPGKSVLRLQDACINILTVLAFVITCGYA